jgi:cytochrome c biogenesis protein CcdA/thiol-disulfide isomerase/thioredoxin
MLIALLAYLGGMLTIVSPCILPVLPFVFANAGRSFRRGALPMLAGMALTFAVVASLAAIGGSWVVRANEIGRWIALLLLALFGLALIFPSLSDRATRPLVALGSRLSDRHDRESIWSSLVLGIATGLLWAPCAGPILGIIFTTAAIQGATLGTTLLLLAYASGAATSLALALLVGGKVYSRMKGSLHATEWIRRGLGVLVIVGVLAIALGLDTRVLAKLSSTQTNAIESGIARKLGLGGPQQTEAKIGAGGRLELPVEGQLPSLEGLGPWINSAGLTREQLRGKVVLIDFWTYSCINCIRSIPYVRAWHETYEKEGLVIIGVHAPEFAFERDPDNVRKAVRDLGIRYPVALDNKLVVWTALKNNYWPAHYFFDAQGRQRYHHFGEGHYDRSEMVIRQLLAEAGRAPRQVRMAEAKKTRGAEASAAIGSIRSPETYIGYWRSDRFVSPGGQLRDAAKTYAAAPLQLNDWSLEGNWTVQRQSAILNSASGAIAYRFHSRDLHLVLAAPKPVRFRITIDGKAPGAAAGVDVKPDGSGVVTDERLYQLVRQQGDIRDRTFRIEFLDPGVEAFAFTFG